MACFETRGPSFGGLPARGPAARRIMRRSRIEPKSSDDGEGVTIPRVNRDPLSRTAASVNAEFLRAEWNPYQAGTREGVGNRPRAVVGAVVKCFVTATVSIRFGAQLIRRPDGALHRKRCVRRCQGQTAAESRLVSRSRGSGRRKRTGRGSGRRRAEERGAKKQFSKMNSHKGFKSAIGGPAGLSEKASPQTSPKLCQSVRGGWGLVD